MFGFDESTQFDYSNSMRAALVDDQLHILDNQQDVDLIDRFGITLKAGVYGMANNFISLGKFTGLADEDKELWDLEQDYRQDGREDLATEYSESKYMYDLGGDVLASFVPGGAALGALKLAKMGTLGAKAYRFTYRFQDKADEAEELLSLSKSKMLPAAEVSRLRTRVAAWNTAQQAWEGALTSAAVEASLNLGEILNNEGMSAWDKAAQFGTGIAFGSLFQGGIGGAFAYKAASGRVNIANSQTLEVEQFPYLYRESGLGDTGDKIAESAVEINRIDMLEANTPFALHNKNEQIQKGRERMAFHLQDAINKSDVSEDVIKPFQTAALKKLDTPDGRAEVANLMRGSSKVSHTMVREFDKQRRIKTAYESLDVRPVSDGNLGTFGQAVKDGKLGIAAQTQLSDGSSGVDIILGRIDADTELSVMDMDGIVQHYNDTLSEAFKKKYKNFDTELETVGFNYGIDVKNDPLGEFKTMQRAYQDYTLDPNIIHDMSYEVGRYLKTMGDEVAEDVYSHKNDLVVDLTTGNIQEEAIKNLGDQPKFKLASNGKSMSYVAEDGSKRKLGTKDLSKLKYTKDVVEYQGLRAIAATERTLNFGNKGLSGLDARDWFKVESYLLRGDNLDLPKVKLGNKSYLMQDVKAGLADFKATELDRLLKANKELDMLSAANTLGVSTKFIQSRGGVGKFTDARGASWIVEDADYITAADNVIKPRSITVSYRTPDIGATTNGDVLADIASEQAARMQRIKDDIATTYFQGRWDDMPEMIPLNDVSGYGTRRFTTNAAQIGGYGSTESIAQQIGERLHKLNEDVYLHEIQAPYTELLRTHLSNDQFKSEYAAFKHWYYQQGASYKFLPDSNILVDSTKYDQVLELTQNSATYDRGLSLLEANKDYFAFQHSGTADFVKAQQSIFRRAITDKRVRLESHYANYHNFDDQAIYIPPRNYEHMTFIVSKNNVFDMHSERVLRVTGINEEDLRAKVAETLKEVQKNDKTAYEASRKDVGAYKQALSKYEWQGREIRHAYADSDLTRRGAAPDASPETNVEVLLQEELEWAQRQVANLNRLAVDTYYADDLAALRRLDDMADSQAQTNLLTTTAAKVIMGDGVLTERKVSDYGQVMATLRGFDDAGHSVWADINHGFERIGAKAIGVLKGSLARARVSQADKDRWIKEGEAVKARLEEQGVGVPMGDYVEARLRRQGYADEQSLKDVVSTANAIQGHLMFRMDWTDAAINVMSSVVKIGGEVKYLADEAAKAGRTSAFDNALLDMFGAGGKTEEGVNLLSGAKAYSESAATFFTAEGREQIKRWVDSGLMVENKQLLRDAFEEVKIDTSDAFKSNTEIASKFKENGSKLLDAIYSVNDQSNLFVQYAALNVAEKLGTAAGLSGSDLVSFMHTFNRRANSIASSTQKPRLFQGGIGMGIGLYQSYMFHMINNIFRYAESGNKAAPALIAALNGTLFGAQSVPGFQALNSHIASRTVENTDLYGAAATVLGSDVNDRDAYDFVMYGAASGIFQANLYSRGDLNPRTPTLIPTSLAAIPTVNQLGTIVKSTVDASRSIMQGEEVGDALRDWTAGVIMNRPIKGMLEVARGSAVDSQYRTIAFHDDTFDIATAVRAAGLKPMAQAQIQDYQNRLYQYKAADNERKKVLGREIRRKYDQNPEVVESEEELDRWLRIYTKAGGNPDSFGRYLETQLRAGELDLSQRLDKMIGSNPHAIAQYEALLGI